MFKGDERESIWSLWILVVLHFGFTFQNRSLRPFFTVHGEGGKQGQKETRDKTKGKQKT